MMLPTGMIVQTNAETRCLGTHRRRAAVRHRPENKTARADVRVPIIHVTETD